MEESATMTKKEVAERLNISVRAVERLLERGLLKKLPGIGKVRIARVAVEAYLEGR